MVSGTGSRSTESSYVNKYQLAQLTDVMNRGSSMMNSQMNGGMSGQMFQNAKQIQPLMQGMFSDLSQTSAGTSGAMQGLGAMGQVGGGNPYLQQNLDALGSNLGRQFNQQIMPAIAQGAVQSGGFGGGRQGVAQGMAAQGLQDAFQQGASSLMNQSSQQSLAANQAMGSLQNQAGMSGLQGADSLFQMGLNPYMAQWLPMQMQQGLIGNLAIEGKSKKSGESFGYNAASPG